MRKQLNKNENDKGFTLIELLVVIIIIGILAAIAIPIFLNQRKKAVDASMKSDTRSIATQVETFYTDDQVYPTAVTLATGTPSILTVGTETVIMSPGNVPVVNTNAATGVPATAVCVVVSNTKGSHPFVWISNLGGLQPSTTTTCPSGFNSITS
jgi:prepilin-type N-terminal cleavage/methylation domain-containing protein